MLCSQLTIRAGGDFETQVRVHPGRDFCVIRTQGARATTTIKPHLSALTADLERTWQRLGAEDPLWAVLTWAGKEGRRWDADEFLATGEDWVAGLAASLEALGLTFGGTRALDFGCGAGRLTQALAGYFGHVTGVDISSSMVDAARSLNRRGERARFVVNTAPDLRLFEDGTFDFVLSLLTLQHIPSRLALGYVREFMRVLRPGGVAVFQAPDGPLGLTRLAVRLLPARVRALRRGMQMHPLPQREVRAAVEDGAARVLHVEDDHMVGPRWRSARYYVRRQ